MIHVTKTFLPPLSEYNDVLAQAWEAGWITNRGALVQSLETQLQQYLESPPMIAMTNGTLPLQIAIRALGLEGEIITTPFSYVATASSIVWEGCTPVFVDIHPDYLTIDESRIKQAITERTSAILATHVFGNPCDLEAIERIAQKYSLKVIYDAAHCFGVRYKGKSVFGYGDISTCSFHATKIFHTGEGGAIFTEDAELRNTLFYHHNFGHKGKEAFQGLGINGKMSELQAAMGLAILPYMDELIQERKTLAELYLQLLEALSVRTIQLRPGTEWNYSYFPVIFESHEHMVKVDEALKAKDIFPRKYFYPSLETLPYVESGEMPVSSDVASRILCVPFYNGLSIKDVESICAILTAALS